MRRFISTVIAALLLAASSSVLAADWFVDAANDGFADGSSTSPYPTIQQGIDAASPGDIVRVAAGTYMERLLMADGVSVIGAGAQVTTIDASLANGPAVHFDETRDSPRLKGFTIRGGTGIRLDFVGNDPRIVGGGIMIASSSPIVQDCVITDNVLDVGIVRGGGIYISNNGVIGGEQPIPFITGNVIKNNVAKSTTVPNDGIGGGVFIVNKVAGVILTDNVIENNVAVQGGGISVRNITEAPVDIQRNVIRNNQATAGAGIYLEEFDASFTTIINNLIVGNGSTDGVVDCDDLDGLRSPSLPEACDDGIDNDCDPATPDIFDGDGDGFDCNLDCNDLDPAVNDATAEICNDLIDNDCDGLTDLDDTVDCDCPDVDLDGYACADCDDDDDAVFPGAVEICGDGIDNDCDAMTLDFFDTDNDGFDCSFDCDDNDPETFPGSPEIVCDGIDNDCNPGSEDTIDADNDAFPCGLDCDDGSPAVNPRVPEFCFDGIDNNCDGLIDLDDLECACDNPVDQDGDGFRCADCNDGNPTVNPAANEVCGDQVDNDCDPTTTDFFDGDNDGFLCDQDCDDSNPNVSDANPEKCDDGIDNDCDGLVDGLDVDDCGCPDNDGDGYACADCDDEEPTTNPGADELCDDGVDNDCDGATADLFDEDGDGFDCTVDCRDTDPKVRPDTGENCWDLLDNDCDGLIDWRDPADPMETIVEFGDPIRYLANYSDPGLGLAWTAEFFDDTNWANGLYGVGYEIEVIGAHSLLLTTGRSALPLKVLPLNS